MKSLSTTDAVPLEWKRKKTKAMHGQIIFSINYLMWGGE